MSASTANMNRLMKKKDELETDIKALFEVLNSQRGVGMNEPLVDKDGYPRNDIDVYTVRNARHDINCLQNDHQALMVDIEEELYKIHAAAAANKQSQDNTDISDGIHTTNDVQQRLSPFLKVNQVDEGSPASSAKLQVGDEILKFGSITSQNFQSLQDIAAIVQHSKGKPLSLTISRGGSDMRLSLTPNTWSGRGLLGCNIVPLKTT